MQEEIKNTSFVLYHFLLALQVKASKMTVCRLLDNPLGNSLRGISDALDALHIDNAVYQLPVENIDKLESPFIAVLDNKNTPFCLVEQREETDLTVRTPQAHLKISRQQFLRKWTGGVLVGEVTEQTLHEKACLLKNAIHWIWQQKLLVAGIIIAFLIIMYSHDNNYPVEFSIYLITLETGIFISSFILYKEFVNNHFLDRFCHVGKVIDCNEVLNSRGSRIMGMRLGEISLFYFTTLLIFTLMRPHDFYGFSMLCCLVATVFTLYSIIYQLRVVRKGCLLCMLINLAVWSNGITLYLSREHTGLIFSIQAAFYLAAISLVYMLVWLQIKSLLRADKERRLLKDRLSGLFKPGVFWHLLAMEPQIGATLHPDMVVHNDHRSENRLTIIINPNCKNCAKALSSIKDLSCSLSVSLILLTSMNDRLGERIAQMTITAYQTDGWNNAMQVLEKWYETRNIGEMEEYDVSPHAEEIWKKQQHFCRKQNIDRTPCIFVNEYGVPEMYPLSELKYVLL